MYKVTVFGLGFVGLTTALGFAEKGHTTFGFDVNHERMEMIIKGVIPFMEPGLNEALTRHLDNKFFLVENPIDAVRQSDFIFLCVGTPCGANGQADLKYIYSAINMFSDILNDGKYRVMVIKSTVPPSTTQEKVTSYLRERGLIPGKAFGISNNPEFLREGRCWDDFINADRIVCGVCDDKSSQMLQTLYREFNAPFFAVSLNTAEFIKYLSNTLLSTMISYANEMSKIGDVIGDIDIKDAFKVLHIDKRWGGCNMASYVYPGCGYGGYCLPKDTQAMYAASLEKGFEPMILKKVIETNESMPDFMAHKICKILSPSDNIGILGLSFKPDSDDVRDSASGKIIAKLIEAGYHNLLAYDPIANEAFKKDNEEFKLIYCASLEEIQKRADVLVILTAWQEFLNVNEIYPDKTIIDCRYVL